VFVLKPLPHKRFSRRGSDLVYKVTLPLYQALVGTAVEILTLDDRWGTD
jgi:DnaJ-class molecular chaperone